jgi:PI-3-kinase-related kinase SMG-1
MLANLRSTLIPMPGLAADLPPSSQPSQQPRDASSELDACSDELGRVCIERFGEKMAVLPTKTQPKKLMLHGTDGKEYNYLLKGREDLHLDERIMQFLRVLNGMLKEDRHTRTFASLRARHYAVLPLGPRSGLIQWVQNVTPLYSVYKAWQQRMHFNAVLRERGAEAELPTETVASCRPADTFYSKLSAVLSASSLPHSSVRKDWSHEVLRKVLQELIAETPRDLLAQVRALHSALNPLYAGRQPSSDHTIIARSAYCAMLWCTSRAVTTLVHAQPAAQSYAALRHTSVVAALEPKRSRAQELWCQSCDTSEWWLKTQSFARSSAVMSMVGYVIGLGDRHLDNILLDLRSGELLHIDYNVCFEKGLRLKVPETVPFRMTQTMQAALGVSGPLAVPVEITKCDPLKRPS